MITVTQDQIYDRWDLLTPDLREALVSDVTSDFVKKTAEAEHIPSDSIYIISGIVGNILFGFLHPEDLAKEITNALQIDPRIANSISTAVNQRIFTPLRAQIDAVYRPVTAVIKQQAIASKAPAAPAGPRIIDEITPIVPVGAKIPSPASAGKPPSPSQFSEIRVGSAVVPLPPSPKSFSQPGWSSGKPSTSGTRPSFAEVTAPRQEIRPPASNTVQKPIPSTPSQISSSVLRQSTVTPSPAPVNAFQRPTASIQSPVPAIPVPPKPPTPTVPATAIQQPKPMPGPMILHSDISMRPLENVPNLQGEKSIDKIAAIPRSGASQIPATSKPAVIEFAGQKPPQNSNQKQPSAPRVVNYSSSSSTFSPRPSAPQPPIPQPPNGQ